MTSRENAGGVAARLARMANHGLVDIRIARQAANWQAISAVADMLKELGFVARFANAKGFYIITIEKHGQNR